MISVAICALGASGDEEARALAADLGGVLYEMRLKLAQPPPIVLLRTADEAAAASLVKKLEARGHDAVAIDESAVPDSFAVRAFRFGDTAFECDDGSLAYGDVLALVRAARPLRIETTEKVTERKLRPGAALATGGLVLTKKVTKEQTHVSHDREDLLYVFRSAGGAPWVVSERGTIYASLAGVARTQRENFRRVVSELRERAPAAAYDERLLAVRNLEDPRAIDLRAEMIAVSLARKVSYR